MSREHARACLEKMRTDDVFRTTLLALRDVAVRIEIINAERFACSAAEIGAVCAELTDAELDCVSGGADWTLAWDRSDVTPNTRFDRQGNTVRTETLKYVP